MDPNRLIGIVQDMELIEAMPHYLDRILSAIEESPRRGVAPSPLPLVSIGPSGIGGYAQKEMMP